MVEVKNKKEKNAIATLSTVQEVRGWKKMNNELVPEMRVEH